MTPSISTLLWGRVTTPGSISTRHTDTMQPTIWTPNGPMEDGLGCQDHLDTSSCTPYMTVILPNRMTKQQGAHAHDNYAKQ